MASRRSLRSVIGPAGIDLVPNRDHRMSCGAAASPRRRTIVISWSGIPAVTVEWNSQRTSAPYALYELAARTPAIIIIMPMRPLLHSIRNWRRHFDDLCRAGCASERGRANGEQGCYGEISRRNRHSLFPLRIGCAPARLTGPPRNLQQAPRNLSAKLTLIPAQKQSPGSPLDP
jgi:hypothetical protein